MAEKTVDAIQWLKECEDQDYPAAESFLGLIFKDEEVGDFIDHLKNAPLKKFKAKDILRASGLKALGEDNAHVAKDDFGQGRDVGTCDRC